MDSRIRGNDAKSILFHAAAAIPSSVTASSLIAVMRLVQRNPAREPAIGQIAAAKPLKLASRTDAFGCRIKPKCQQNAWIDGRAARLALDGLDG